jgi:membrane protein implicated in regulation of membrane protease activity
MALSAPKRAENRSRNPFVILRYALIQLPALTLFILALHLVQSWVMFPGWLFWVAILAWIIKDIVLYPFVWRAYDREWGGNMAALIGSRGVAKERLAPTGYIQVHGELWRAEVPDGSPPIEPGDSVLIRQVRGVTLVVEVDARNHT